MYAGSRLNSALLEGARSDAAVHDSAALTLRQITDIMLEAVSCGKTVARLHTGDPSLYGAIAEWIAIVRDAGVHCAVLLGFSSVFADAGRAEA